MLPSSVGNAPRSKPEERLFPLWKLIGLGVCTLVVFGVLYHNQKVLQQVAQVKNPNDISLFFLKNIQEEHPQEELWRILLAKQQVNLGELSLAQETLRPLFKSQDSVLQKDARFIDLQILEMQILVSGKPERMKQNLQLDMVERIDELLQYSMSSKDLSSLAESALLVGDWKLATKVYRQLAQVDQTHQAKWFRKGATLVLGQGAYAQAAELFFLARAQSQSIKEKREDYLSGLKALIEGNLLQEALVEAEKHLGDLSQDEVILKYLVKLGRAAGNGGFAQKYVEKLLHLASRIAKKIFVTFVASQYEEEENVRAIGNKKSKNWFRVYPISNLIKVKKTESKRKLRPYDAAIYELAYTVYVENGAVEAAYDVAVAASAAVPEDLTWRQRWAQVAEWTGRGAEALAQWQVVVQQQPSPEAWAALVRLAPGLTQPAERSLAQAALALVVAQGPPREQRAARWALLALAQQQAVADSDAATRAAIGVQVQALVGELQSVAEGERLLRVGLAHEQWAVVEKVLAYLAQQGTPEQVQGWYQQSAETALGHGAYAQAAAWWFVVQAQAGTRTGQRAAFQAGLQALVAGQQVEAVPAAVARQLGALATDPAAVGSAVTALRAAGAGAAASEYVAALWAAGAPVYDAAIYELAYTVYVENGAVEAAYDVAVAASAAVPEDLTWRQRWAQVAEWTGRGAEALAQWQVVVQQQPSPEAWAALVRLAPGLTQPAERSLAQAALALVVAQGPPREQRAARWALLALAQQQAVADSDAATRAAIGVQVQALVGELQSVAEGERLLRVGLAHEQWAVVEKVLAYLAQQGTPEQVQGWYQQSAETALGHGAYAQAAAWWFVVQAQAGTRTGQRAAFQAGLQALVAGQQVEAVPAAVARQLGALATDPAAVGSAVTALRAAGAGAAASEYVAALWAAGAPVYDAAIYELAYTVYVENGAVEAAYDVAVAASAAVPEDLTWRQRWAQVAEWTGRGAEALAQWQVVVQQQPSPEAWAALVRLAPGLTQPAERSLAQAALALVVAQGPPREQRAARWALLALAQQQAVADSDAATRAAIGVQVQALVGELQSVAEGERLLRVGLAHEQWAVVEKVLAYLAQQGTPEQVQGWYQQSAETALGHGAYAQAAAWWFVVQAQAGTRTGQRAAFQAGLQALVAGQQVEAVPAAVARQLGALATDPAAVGSAVTALRAAGAGAAASEYVAALWAAGAPVYDAAIYELAYTVYVENGAVEAAYDVAVAASAAVPEDLTWRQRWAQVAEWTGRGAEALAQWQVVVQQQPSPEAWAALVRLAPGLTQPAERSLAQAALALVVAQGPPREQRAARWALLALAQQQAVADSDAATRAAIGVQVQALVGELQSVAEGERLLRVGLAHEQWAVVEKVLAYLAQQGTPEQVQGWYQQSAETALGHGAYAQAAAWWFVVQAQAGTRTGQRAAFQAGLQALVAGQQVEAVPAAVARQLGALATDPAAVGSAVTALRAAGAGAAASEYVAALWAAGAPVYDAAIYELAYTVYVENGAVEAAYDVAVAASAAVPEDLTWRQRWAQVAEWTGRGAEALAQWQVVVQQQPSPEAWAALVRLGRGLRNLQAWAFGLEEMNKALGLLPHHMKELAGVYEEMGEPEKAIAQLQHAFDQAPKQEVLEDLGLVYERMGRTQEALEVFDILSAQYGSTMKLAKKRARLLYEQGKLREALTVLTEQQDKAPLDDFHYWETLGDIAWDLQEDAVSRQAYETLFQHKELSAFELERYVWLVKGDDPQLGIQLAQYGWQRFFKVGFFLLGVDILQEEKEWDALARMLEDVTESQLRILEPHQQYWLVRAEVFSRKGDLERAFEAYQEALRHEPHSPVIRLAMLWLLIDGQQLEQLHSLLVKWEKSAAADSRFWSAFATAYMLLGQPLQALPYFEQKFQESPHDYLWVLYYADVLELTGQRSHAWELRQYAWVTLRKEAQSSDDLDWNRDVMLVYGRLALTRESGDRVLALFLRLLRQQPDAATKELILSWYLSREKYDPARFWLWRYYARQLSKPNFASLALALIDNNKVVLDRLLSEKSHSLDRLQQVEAAKRLRRDQLVQTLASEGVESSPTPDLYARVLSDSVLSHMASPLDTHQQLSLTAQLWSGVPHVNTRFRFQNRSPLVFQQIEQLWNVPLGRGIEFHPFISHGWQHNTDRKVFRRVPRADTRIGGYLQWNMGPVLGEFSLYHRQALSAFVSLRGRTQLTWGGRTTSEFLIGRNLEADISVGMLVGGVQDLLRMNHTYQVSKWDTAFLQFDYPRFYSQDRRFLGQGIAVEGAWSHRLRLAYPDITFRLSGNWQRYSRRQEVSGKLPRLFSSQHSSIPVSNVLPKTFSQIELGAGVGESTFFSYGKNIRPFLFGGVNLNPETSVGANISGGIKGSVIGQDQLSLYGRYLRGGFRQDSTVTEWGLQYQLWF